MRTMWIAGVVMMAAVVARGGVDFRGVVKDGKDQPAAGVTVYINSVAPKEGEGFGQGYYADWGKKAATDGEGKFVISDVDPEMRFGVIFVAEGKLPVSRGRVDPSKEMSVTLKALPEDRAQANHQVRGKVTGEDGKPLWGAEVEPTGWGSADRHTYGTDQGVDPLTVTNEKGEFVITGREPDRARDLRITARGYATIKASLQPPGEDVHEFALTKGSTIHGRIVQEGKGLTNVAMQAVQTNRRSETFLAPVEVKSDEQGNFVLANLKADEAYCVTARAKSLPEGLCTAIGKWTTGGEGEVVEAGDMEAVMGKTVKGKVKMPEGRTVPSGSTIRLGGDERWDSQLVKLGKDGAFEFKGIPPGEAVRIYVNLSGPYRLTKDNASLDISSGRGLIGVVEEDIPNLLIAVEEGQAERTRGPIDGNKWQALRTQPLAGVTEEAAGEEKK